MGGKVSKTVAKKVVRPIKNINIEERAQKAVQQHAVNPKVAPKHPSTEGLLSSHIADHPEIKEELDKKDETTIERMSKLNVEMTGRNPEFVAKRRPLPQNRKYIEDPYLLFEDPEKVPETKLSLTHVAAILEKYKVAPSQYPGEMVAKEYKLNIGDAENLLKYYKKLDLDDTEVTDMNITNAVNPAQEQDEIRDVPILPQKPDVKS